MTCQVAATSMPKSATRAKRGMRVAVKKMIRDLCCVRRTEVAGEGLAHRKISPDLPKLFTPADVLLSDMRGECHNGPGGPCRSHNLLTQARQSIIQDGENAGRERLGVQNEIAHLSSSVHAWACPAVSRVVSAVPVVNIREKGLVYVLRS